MSETNGNGLPPAPQGQGNVSARGRKPPPVEHRWKKGQSGNPGGMKKGNSISAELNRLLEKKGAKEAAKAIMEKLLEDGDMRAAEIVLDRTEGKVTQRVENIGAQSIIVIEGVREDAR
jgi:predicted transcriptional regulator